MRHYLTTSLTWKELEIAAPAARGWIYDESCPLSIQNWSVSEFCFLTLLAFLINKLAILEGPKTEFVPNFDQILAMPKIYLFN